VGVLLLTSVSCLKVKLEIKESSISRKQRTSSSGLLKMFKITEHLVMVFPKYSESENLRLCFFEKIQNQIAVGFGFFNRPQRTCSFLEV
jgi:hypothetical protein